MKLSWQNGGNDRERPIGEPSVESVDNEDVVNLSSDASSGDCASLLKPVVEKKGGKVVLRGAARHKDTFGQADPRHNGI